MQPDLNASRKVGPSPTHQANIAGPNQQANVNDNVALRDIDARETRNAAAPHASNVRQHGPMAPLPHPAAPAGAGTFRGLAGMPLHRALTRDDFSDDRLLMHCGVALGGCHSRAQISARHHEPLYLVRDAHGRWDNVRHSAPKAACSKLNIQQVDKTLAYLEQTLTAAAARRVRAPFNYYPQAMRFDMLGNLENRPDSENVDFHAFFEPLARLSYTARLSDEQSQTLLEAYAQERFKRKPTADEMLCLRQANYLFTLLYYAYFIDIAFDTPAEGTEADIARDKSLAAGDALLARLRENQASLAGTGLPKLDLPSP